ncbi:MAG: secretin N-terminal domain-containing protein [Planctomycetota bacterium]
MNPIAILLYAALVAPSDPQLGDTLERGLHSTSTLLSAWESLTRKPLLRAPSLPQRLAWVRHSFTLVSGSEVSIKVILRSAGVYVMPFGGRRTSRYWFASTNPHETPHREREFDVEVIALRYADPDEVARFLNDVVSRREAQRPAHQRTLFAAVTATRRVIARIRRGESLTPFKNIVADLDQPPEDGRRETIRSWRARHRFAADLRRDFLAAWKERGAPTISVVVQKQSNTLLLRLPKNRWEAAEQLLDELDQRRR